MIHISSLYKTIHDGEHTTDILKDITLTLPAKGFVIISGESGSGKTTLLNMMTGLDEPSSGAITILKEEFDKYSASRWDELRRQSIGIVFQDFYIIEEYSVYENLEIVLKLHGITNEEEITEQIRSTLDIVNMKVYIDRQCSALSGGQKQRVAIARSLIMNPKIIFADEPTGNLDRKTTIHIMNVFRNIAKDRLVVFITHEKELAKNFADRIISLKDGCVISDEMNEAKNCASLDHEQILYLENFKRETKHFNGFDISYYYKHHANTSNRHSLEIIENHQTLYVRSSNNTAIRIKPLDQYSDITIKKKADKTTKETQDITVCDVSSTTSQLVTIKDAFYFAKRKINNVRYGGKMLYIALALIGSLIAVSIGILGKIGSIDDDEFIETSRQFVTVTADEITLEEAKSLTSYKALEYVQLIEEPLEFLLKTKPYYEVKNPLRLEAHPTNISLLNESDIVYGRYPESKYEIILDQFIADELINLHQNRGIESYKDIIHSEILFYNSGLPGDYDTSNTITFEIVGISDDNSPTIFMEHELIMSFALSNLMDYKLLEDDFEIVTGSLPTKTKQLLLHENSSLIRNGNVPSFVGIDSGYYEVVGTYRYLKNDQYINTLDLMVTSIDIMEDAYFTQKNYDISGTTFMIYANNRNQAIKDLNNEGYVATSNYLEDFNDYTRFEFQASFGLFVFAVAAIVSSMISTIFILRSSLTARRYELSIYRALGASKNNIRVLFAAEIVLITAVSSLIGYSVTILILYLIQQEISQYVEIISYSIPSILFGVSLVFTINIIFGLIPLQQMIRDTPANNLRHYEL